MAHRLQEMFAARPGHEARRQNVWRPEAYSRAASRLELTQQAPSLTQHKLKLCVVAAVCVSLCGCVCVCVCVLARACILCVGFRQDRALGLCGQKGKTRVASTRVGAYRAVDIIRGSFWHLRIDLFSAGVDDTDRLALVCWGHPLSPNVELAIVVVRHAAWLLVPFQSAPRFLCCQLWKKGGDYPRPRGDQSPPFGGDWG